MNPIELYEFVSPRREYRYTSYGVDVDTDHGLYTAIPIQRAELQVTTEDADQALEISMPVDAELIQDFAYGPGDRALVLTLRTRNGVDGEDRILWIGNVTSTNVEGEEGKVRVPSSLGSQLASPLPSIYYQTQCNHVLYGRRCQASREGSSPAGESSIPFKWEARITRIEEAGRVLVFDFKDDWAPRTTINGTLATPTDNPNILNQWLQGGEVVNESSGDRRLVIEHEVANSGITSENGKRLVLNYRFLNAISRSADYDSSMDISLSNHPGDEITIYAGCDHSIAACKDKFANLENFGGHPNIPNLNPFTTSLTECGTR